MSDSEAAPATSTQPIRAAAYDAIAEGYAELNATSLLNEYYNRPAVVELAGDVDGHRILDVGCGSGPIMEDLRDRGAIVVGIDASARMLEQARARLGDGVDLRVVDLAERLPFDDDTFDDVIASQVLHYLKDWGPALAELHRVLKPGGRLVVSEEHPTALFLSDRLSGGERDYFGIHERNEKWTLGGQAAELTFWDRPLHAMTDAFAAASFGISAISEPAPAPDASERFPELEERKNGRFLAFLLFVLVAEPR